MTCNFRVPLPGLGKRHSPLEERVFKYEPNEHTRTPLYKKVRGIRPNKYCSYNPRSLEKALNAVLYNGLKVSRAAVDYGIPRSTLDDHVKGRVIPGSRSGPATLLTPSEEAELANFLLKTAEIGYPYSRLQAIALVERILQSRGQSRARKVTHGWWSSFSRRHKELSLKVSSSLSLARAKASSAESLSKYFTTLQETLQESKLIDEPGLIYNMDESGFPLEPKPPKTIHKRGENPYHLSKGTKQQVTVVACVNATGQYIPPMVVWARKTMNTALSIGEVPGSVYGLTEKGWMTAKVFHKWFKRHFLRYASAVRPLILFNGWSLVTLLSRHHLPCC